jgi:hypothetical protein
LQCDIDEKSTRGADAAYAHNCGVEDALQQPWHTSKFSTRAKMPQQQQQQQPNPDK